MLLKLGSRLVGFLATGNLVGRPVDPRVAKIDPYPDASSAVKVCGHQGGLGKFFIEIFVDDCRFKNDRLAVDEDGNLGVGV
jgi:hypothetical protein